MANCCGGTVAVGWIEPSVGAADGSGAWLGFSVTGVVVVVGILVVVGLGSAVGSGFVGCGSAEVEWGTVGITSVGTTPEHTYTRI